MQASAASRSGAGHGWPALEGVVDELVGMWLRAMIPGEATTSSHVEPTGASMMADQHRPDAAPPVAPASHPRCQPHRGRHPDLPGAGPVGTKAASLAVGTGDGFPVPPGWW